MSNPCTLKLAAAHSRMAALGTTQAALAVACGIDVRSLQRWFAGQRVSLTHAERLASALGVGTADLFTGVPEETGAAISTRLRLMQRLLSARDNAFAQGLRLVQEHFELVLQSVSFAAHPVRGFVARHPLAPELSHRFVGFRLACGAEQADIAVRCQLGRHFGFVRARLRLRGGSATLVETFHTRSMLAPRAADGSVVLWYWVGPEQREIIFVADRELHVAPCAQEHQQLLELDGAAADHALCIRPDVGHLRAAGLPMGFDRLTGSRAGRVDIPVHWDALPDTHVT